MIFDGEVFSTMMAEKPFQWIPTADICSRDLSSSLRQILDAVLNSTFALLCKDSPSRSCLQRFQELNRAIAATCFDSGFHSSWWLALMVLTNAFEVLYIRGEAKRSMQGLRTSERALNCFPPWVQKVLLLAPPQDPARDRAAWKLCTKSNMAAATQRIVAAGSAGHDI